MQWLDPIREVRRRLNNDTPAWRQVGEIALNRVKSNFLESRGAEPWADLAPSTLLNRARGVSGKGQVYKKSILKTDTGKRLKTRQLTKKASALIEDAKPLIWTGRLLRSMAVRIAEGSAEVYSGLVQANRLFHGWTETKPHTPARSPFFLRQDDRAEILRVLMDWVTAPLGDAR